MEDFSSFFQLYGSTCSTMIVQQVDPYNRKGVTFPYEINYITVMVQYPRYTLLCQNYLYRHVVYDTL